MVRIPCLRFSKGYTKHQSQGHEELWTTRNCGRSWNCSTRAGNTSRRSAIFSAPFFQLPAGQSQIEPGQGKSSRKGVMALAILQLWKLGIITWHVFEHGLCLDSPPILASYNFSISYVNESCVATLNTWDEELIRKRGLFLVHFQRFPVTGAWLHYCEFTKRQTTTFGCILWKRNAHLRAFRKKKKGGGTRQESGLGPEILSQGKCLWPTWLFSN